MKKLAELTRSLEVYSEQVINRLITAQKDTAKKVCEDVKSLAPGNGEYVASIKVSDTTLKDNVIKTAIYTDMTSDNNDEKIPKVVIGRMIEHGTGIYALEPHIGHTKTFKDSGYQYWYVPATSVKHPIGKKITIDGKDFYVAKPQPARPHFLPALISNAKFYKDQIRKAVINDG